jgi:hydrogenase maturation protease
VIPRTDTLVIGVGNCDRGDDGAGIAVARALRDRVGPGVRVVELGSDALGLVDFLRAAPAVIVVDAARSGASPGTIHRFDARSTPLPVGVFHDTSTHAFGVANAIELGRTLALLPDALTVFGIEGEQFTAGATISPRVGAAVEEVTHQLLDLLG